MRGNQRSQGSGLSCLLLFSSHTFLPKCLPGRSSQPLCWKSQCRGETTEAWCGFRGFLSKRKSNSMAAHCSPGPVPRTATLDLRFRERVRVSRNWALARGPRLLWAQAPAAGLGQPGSEVPTPSLWRQQAGWEGWWEPESSGLEGTGARIRGPDGWVGPSQGCLCPSQGQRPKAFKGVRRQARRVA